jgi:hypothetical protein
MLVGEEEEKRRRRREEEETTSSTQVAFGPFQATSRRNASIRGANQICKKSLGPNCMKFSIFAMCT